MGVSVKIKMCQMLTVTLMATYCMGQLLRAAEMVFLPHRPQEESSDKINRLPLKVTGYSATVVLTITAGAVPV